MPLCEASSGGVVHAVLRDGEDSFVGEEQLLDGTDGTFGGRMAAVRRVAFESGPEEGGNAALQDISGRRWWGRAEQLT
jgi:hypothetical protein